MKRLKRVVAAVSIIGCIILIVGYLLPMPMQNPVVGASKGDWNTASFWYYPWGRSVVHKGVDIFAKSGTNVRSSTYGIVFASGYNNVAGNYLVVLGPKWRFHYYAHLNTKQVGWFNIVTQNSIIATVGNTGNATGKAPHLHYAIVTPIPYVWRYSNGPHGARKMFYLDPTPYL